MARTQTVQDVMTANPITVPASAALLDVARTMRDSGIGDIIVMDGDQACGIVTDRDVVVRGVADGKDPATTRVNEICSRRLTSVAPNASVDDAVKLMREKAIRRLPVMKDGHPVGVVSIGDLAIERDGSSALAEISAAPANR